MEQIKSIGLILNELRKKKKVSVIELADKLGVKRQAIYDTFGKRTSLSIEDMKRWADALGVSVQLLLDLSTGKMVQDDKLENDDVPSDQVLLLIRKMFEDELREKNEQIKALQEALRESQQMSRVLLGKSRECLDRDVLPMYPNGIHLPAETA